MKSAGVFPSVFALNKKPTFVHRDFEESHIPLSQSPVHEKYNYDLVFWTRSGSERKPEQVVNLFGFTKLGFYIDYS